MTSTFSLCLWVCRHFKSMQLETDSICILLDRAKLHACNGLELNRSLFTIFFCEFQFFNFCIIESIFKFHLWPHTHAPTQSAWEWNKRRILCTVSIQSSLYLLLFSCDARNGILLVSLCTVSEKNRETINRLPLLSFLCFFQLYFLSLVSQLSSVQWLDFVFYQTLLFFMCSHKHTLAFLFVRFGFWFRLEFALGIIIDFNICDGLRLSLSLCVRLCHPVIFLFVFRHFVCRQSRCRHHLRPYFHCR